MNEEKVRTALKYAINELEHAIPMFDPNQDLDPFEGCGVIKIRIDGGINLIREALEELDKE